MAGWSIRRGDAVQDGLTVYQVQEQVRSGKLGPDDEITQDGTWIHLSEHPTLAKLIPGAPPPEPKPGDVVQLHGVEVRLGPDGKPLPPDAATVAKMLSASMGDRADSDSVKQVRVITTVLLAIMLIVGAVICFQMMRFFFSAQ